MRRALWVVAALLAIVGVVPAAAQGAAPPVLSWTPSTAGNFGFGTVNAGQAVSQVFTLGNTGGSATSALAVTVSGAGFTKTADTCTATSLGPKKTCKVTVRYSPTAAGSNDTATLTASSKKPAAAASITLTGAGTAVAVRHLYWTMGTESTIGRATVDGTGANAAFISTPLAFPRGIAVDDAHVFWGTSNPFVGRANLDGTGRDDGFIGGATLTNGVAVNGQHVYWADGSSALRIGRANLDGSAVDTDFIHPMTAPQDVAVDGSHVYWSGGIGQIGRANLDGTGIEPAFIDATGAGGLAVDAGHIYWADEGGGQIGRANLDGTGVNPAFIGGLSFPRDVTVDSSFVYWGARGSIGRANLDGSSPNNGFIGLGIIFAHGVAVDAG